MKILVTGGAGFIASHIVDAYVDQGHEVVVIDNLSSGKEENINPKAKFYKMDIRDEKVDDLFAQNQFDVVNHHAAQMDVRRSVADPAFDAQVNVLGTINLLQSSVKHKISKFIFSSTGGAVYGEQEYFPADETHPTWPISPYGITKLTCEKYLFYYKEVFNLPHVIFRYSNVYGPRQSPHGEAGVVAIFSKLLLNGEQPTINGSGKQTRDYVYVGDLVRINVMALAHDRSDVFNVGTSVETDVNELFHLLNRFTDAGKEEFHGPEKAGEQLRSCILCKKAEDLLGWKAEVDLNAGLQKTVEFFRNEN
ncbi:MAG: NAD-dependent epimerase/dehydratase family protein [bacterium]